MTFGGSCHRIPVFGITGTAFGGDCHRSPSDLRRMPITLGRRVVVGSSAASTIGGKRVTSIKPVGHVLQTHPMSSRARQLKARRLTARLVRTSEVCYSSTGGATLLKPNVASA